MNTQTLADADSPGVVDTLLRMDTPLVPPVTVRGVPEGTVTPMTLGERMSSANVPGVSVAVVMDYKVVWAEGFGFADVESARPVTEKTLFQAASISKPVAAYGAMKLVQEGLITLDGDIEDFLTSWKLPRPTDGAPLFTDQDPVTLRLLLGHNAGTNVRGFPGYPTDEYIPSPVEVLEGKGNTDPVAVVTTPGSAHAYSGGGYTIAQVAMLDVSEGFSDYPALMSSIVLTPLGMEDSTFEQPLPAALHDNAAIGYDWTGAPLDGNWRVHPEMAAAGLWTTPTDLARFFVSIQSGMAGIDGPVLESKSVQEMLKFEGEVRYGLGISVGTERVGHGGGNQGFRCVATFMNEGGDGVVIMSNGDNGWDVNADILRTLFVNLDWPGLRPIEKTAITMSRQQLDQFAGTYLASTGLAFNVSTDDSGVGLQVQTEGMKPFKLVPESPTTFFDPADGIPIVFELDESGRAIAATWSDIRAVRE